MSHWAKDLIGRPWAPDGEGPASFSCWGLVRWVFRERYDIDMPPIKVGDFSEGENVTAIKRAVTASGWKPHEGEPQDGDIVLMHGPKGRHVGVMVRMSRGLVLLHSSGCMTVKPRTLGGDSRLPVPVGSVVAEPLAHALASGYSDVELWRLS